MTRIIRMASIFPVVAVFFFFSAPAEANLLENPGFEIGVWDNFEPWERWGDAYVEPWAARTGTNGLAIYGWTPGGGVYQEVDADGASNFTFSVWGFRDSEVLAEQMAELKLEFADEHGHTLSVAVYIIEGTQTWTRYSLSAVAPAGTAVVRPVIAAGGPEGAEGAFKWDDAELVSTELPPGGPEAFVSLSGANVYPYTNWATAAHGIQQAVETVNAGGTVWVGDGEYGLSQRIRVDKAVTIQSVNGPLHTVVNGNGADRCFDVIVPGVTIEGFTITNGFRYAAAGSTAFGAGVRFADGGTLRNCIVTGNRVEGQTMATLSIYGGGIHAVGETLIENCVIRGNRLLRGAVRGGGVYATGAVWIVDSEISENEATGSSNELNHSQPAHGGGVHLIGGKLENSVVADNLLKGGYTGMAYGGGFYAENATVTRCDIRDNMVVGGGLSGFGFGGGGRLIFGSVIENSLVRDNTARGVSDTWRGSGGGLSIRESSIIQCTIVSNTATGGAGGIHAYGTGNVVENTIVYYSEGTNWTLAADATISMSHCCTTPLPDGGGHIESAPGFVDMESGDFRLAAGSPCIDAGAESGFSPDLDGVPRPLDGNNDGTAGWDIGAYEFIHPYADTDQDGMPDADEIRAGTDPTDPESVLRVFPPDEVVPGSGEVVIRWSSAAGRQYTLLRTTHLTNAFVTIQSDIEATPPENVWVDSTATGSGPYYYRIRLD